VPYRNAFASGTYMFKRDLNCLKPGADPTKLDFYANLKKVFQIFVITNMCKQIFVTFCRAGA
jgi:hypothetical protein